MTLILIEQGGDQPEIVNADNRLRVLTEMIDSHYERTGFPPPWIWAWELH
jgi:hypothetical protein